MNTNYEQTSFTIPLSMEAHEKANQRKKGISNTENAKKIYLNTLATYAVKYYLDCMGFETNCSDADKSNPWMLSLIDLADLEVKNVGKIECRPVLPDAEYLEIPSEVRSNRVAYVAVQFNQTLKEATILGFTTQTLAKVPLSQLESVDNLLDYLTTKEKAAKVNISQWLEGVFTEGWLNVEEIFNPRELSLRFVRNFSVTKCKKIDIGLHLNDESVVLVVKLNPKNQEITDIKNQNKGEIDIIVQVQADTERSVSLPPGLKLVVTDENGQEVDAAVSRLNDNWMDIELSAELNEEFSVEIILGESKVTEDFVV
ncbi:DUF1822 family protein [Plectonema cf. radiosum LEGE 06105]|uniref:DUF1822 family protein n=1 Tax=Plectonema cf. radiosum LEGE 06105 TaxID=945769 RepID=A0A8J7F6C3_9CYAN|nr:DUF1822 family protein [Plectonema radiosum]MBE9215403.1 DUF1822 family protein [Plectonema cf. radiosum LEGE 06105]